jgi:hypothetical protein
MNSVTTQTRNRTNKKIQQNKISLLIKVFLVTFADVAGNTKLKYFCKEDPSVVFWTTWTQSWGNQVSVTIIYHRKLIVKNIHFCRPTFPALIPHDTETDSCVQIIIYSLSWSSHLSKKENAGSNPAKAFRT